MVSVGGYDRGVAGLVTSSLTAPERIAKGMSSSEYYDLPDEHPRCELIDGELWMAPSPSFRHQETLGELFAILRAHVKAKSRGHVTMAPLDVELFDDTVVQPDIIVLAPDHPQVLTRKGVIQVPPMLAIEIISPGSVAHDRGRKFRVYEKAGI